MLSLSILNELAYLSLYFLFNYRHRHRHNTSKEGKKQSIPFRIELLATE
jgi:hypothetical protein